MSAQSVAQIPISSQTIAQFAPQYLDLNEGHPELYLPGVIVTVLAAASYIAPLFISIPYVQTIQIVALGVLALVRYGIVSDIFSAKKCIEYFTVGHSEFHKKLIDSDNPYLNGIVAGIGNSWVGGCLMGVVMAICARCTSLVALNAIHLAPFVLGISIATYFLSDYACNKEEAKWLNASKQQELSDRFNTTITPKEGFHPVDLRQIPEDKRAAYLAIKEKVRAEGGSFLLGTSVLAIGIIAVRIFLTVRQQVWT
jgi:hypothetical protein